MKPNCYAFSVMRLFVRDWSLESLTPPWGELGSIYDHIRLGNSGPLPDESIDQEQSKLRWSSGSMDGVLGHHMGGSDPMRRVFEITHAVQSLLGRADDVNLSNLYRFVAKEPILTCADALLKRLAEEVPAKDRTRLLEVGLYFATRAGHREAVKFGIMLIGLSGTANDLEILQTLGRNEEFTLYAAVAMTHVAPEPEHALWELARNVRDWGRIQTVERLKDTKNQEIQAWMLREGFRNGVMDEYLACICARAGKLHKALKQKFVDDPLLDGAADIICALITGGPAENIDDYAQAAEACETYVNLVWSRRNLGLRHLITVARLRQFLVQPEGWDKRENCGWTEAKRRTLQSVCDDVLAWETWPAKIGHALAASDEQNFFVGDIAAYLLSIDTWEMHFARVMAAPLTSPSWYRLMQQTDESRIDRVLAFTESVLPFERIETGPSEELGLGPEFEPHRTLDWVLQDLRRFPHRGWRLIKAGLRSPVIRNRHMAINALATWSRESWPGETADLLQEIHASEPNDRVKGRLSVLIDGMPLS